MNQMCYEITQYKLLSGAEPEAYKGSVEMLNAMLPELPGFVQRDVYYRTETKHWVEVIIWESEAAAKKAEETLMAHPVCKQGFAFIDMETVTLEFYSKISGVSTNR